MHTACVRCSGTGLFRACGVMWMVVLMVTVTVDGGGGDGDGDGM